MDFVFVLHQRPAAGSFQQQARFERYRENMYFLSIARTWIESKNILEVTVMVFLLGIYFFPTENSLKNFYYAAILFPYLLTVSIAELKGLLRSRLFVVICVFVFYNYFTIIWNPATRQSEYLGYFGRVIYLLVFVSALCRIINRNENYLSRFFNWMVYVAGMMSVVSIGVFYADHAFPAYRLENWGALYHANVAAACYGLAAVICYCHFLTRKPNNRGWVYALILAMLLIDIALTWSRGVWLALVVTFALTQILRRRYFLVIVPLIAGIAYVSLIQMNVIESSWVFMRDGGDNFRFAAWTKALERIVRAPWFGYGVNTDETLKITENFTMYHAHSVYVSQVIYGGIVGGILLGTIALLNFIEAISQSRIRHDPTYAAMVLFALICVATDHHKLLLNPAQIWFFFWFPIAIVTALTISPELSSKTSSASINSGNHAQPKPMAQNQLRNS